MNRIRHIAVKRMRGFSLVAAVFILVVLAALGAFMVTIGEVERATTVGAAQGARAYQAAQAGIEWGIYGALNNRAATCGGAPSTPTTNTIAAAAGLNGFTVDVVCSYTDEQENGITGSSAPQTAGFFKVFTIAATATFGTFGTPDFFSRSLQVALTDAP